MKLLFISLTNLCNRSCSYCPMAFWRNNPDFPNTLTLKKCIKAIELLDPTHVEITGGEPTMVPWLDDLTDYLDRLSIIYLVKSNGYRRCKNQVTAWHDGIDSIPDNYDKILIIHNMLDWQQKYNYCTERSIPCAVIGKDTETLGPHQKAATFFLCPDGHLKICHEQETNSIHNIDQVTDAKTVGWKVQCNKCKAVNDFFLFLEDK